MSALWDHLEKEIVKDQSWGTLLERFGANTPHEAIVRVSADDDNQWSGYLVYRYERYSPNEGSIAHRWWIYPSSASGAHAVGRAQVYWESLNAIFTALEAQRTGEAPARDGGR